MPSLPELPQQTGNLLGPAPIRYDLALRGVREMRMWLHRAELDAMLTRELQKVAGCAGSALIAGAQISVADFE